MQNGPSKYVPPHLRNSTQSSGADVNNNNNRNQNDAATNHNSDVNSGPPPSNYSGGGRGSGGGGGGRGGGYSSGRGGGGGGRGGSGGGGYYNNDSRNGSFNDGGGAPSSQNSRWNNNDSGGGGGSQRYNNNGGGGGRGGGGGYNGGSSSSSSLGGPRRNARNFHGDMTPDKRLEQRLFHTGDKQTTGINFDNYDKIPCEVSGSDVPLPIDVYTAETIGDDLYRNTQLCGYSRPTPVQKYSIPIGERGRDLMACAQTGSGKTAGFLFPILMSMIKAGGQEPPMDHRGSSTRTTYPEALVLAPTRELAQQIYEEGRRFAYCTGIACVCIYGGADIRDQLRQIERGCDLLVGTPGRLVDLIERGRIAMTNVRFLVLDEADRMLDMGFEPQIRRIVQEEGMPNGDNRQTMMFSATFPANIQRLASDFLNDYVYLTVGRVGSASKDVAQNVEYVEERDKIDTLMKFLYTVEDGLILIFVETKRSCDYIEDVLCQNGFPACSIHGDKSQNEREDALRAFKSGTTPIMVGTDVASRGLDIPNVTQVINYDLPTNIDDYVHRIGRTGRAGNTGSALSFINEKNVGVVRELRDMLAENDQNVPLWLDQMTQYSGSGGGRSGGGGRGRGRGGGRGGGNTNYGSRDVRYSQGNQANNGDRQDNRGGGGYGGGGGGGGGGYNGGGGGFNQYGNNAGNFGAGAW